MTTIDISLPNYKRQLT